VRRAVAEEERAIKSLFFLDYTVVGLASQQYRQGRHRLLAGSTVSRI
jgi:hypothetical protein